MIKRLNNTVVITCLMALLTACGSTNKVVVDESADYKSARSFPGLKKNSDQKTVVSASATQSNIVDVPVKPSIKTQISDAPQDSVTTRLLEISNEITRLSVLLPIDQAWVLIGERLKRSGFTIQSRNKTAHRFAIGCGDVSADKNIAKNSGKWSFFKKDLQETEYCTIQLRSDNNGSVVSVLNRFGQEAMSKDTTPILQRLLN